MVDVDYLYPERAGENLTVGRDITGDNKKRDK